MSINRLYSITAKTNLHVGSGDSNAGVIDNLVQRDPITNLPVIHSSSLKGAFRQHFVNLLSDNTAGITAEVIKKIFGGEKSDTMQGNARFFTAQLLSRPFQSDVKLFYRISSPGVLREFAEFSTMLGAPKTFNQLPVVPVVKDGLEVYLDDLKINRVTPSPDFSTTEPLIGENPGLLESEQFRKMNDSLPVIARNHLENGESKNLWYEEIVPRESRFYFGIIFNMTEADVNLFESHVVNKIIQIGANATIGYGYCLITKN